MDLETILKIKAERKEKEQNVYVAKEVRHTNPATGKEQTAQPEPRSL